MTITVLTAPNIVVKNVRKFIGKLLSMVSTSLENLLGKLNCYEIANKLIHTVNGIAMSLFINRRQDVVFALRYLLNS